MIFFIKLANHKVSRQLRKYGFLISVIAITIVATVKSGNLPEIALKSDKVNHVLAFGFLTLMVNISYPQLSTFKKLFCLLTYGVALELIQFFLPWRSCSMADIVADVIGIVIATAGLEIIQIHHKHAAEKLKRSK